MREMLRGVWVLAVLLVASTAFYYFAKPDAGGDASSELAAVSSAPEISLLAEAGADDEEEAREDLIRRCEPVPFGVAQGGVDMAPASRVVDQDHAGDGETPEAVEGG